MAAVPTSAAPSVPAPAPAPLKLKFRLGGGASGGSSSLSSSASASAPAPAASSVGALSPRSELGDDPLSAFQSPAAPPIASTSSLAPAIVSSAPVTAAGQKVPGEKPKRKRAPKRPPGEAGPGKAWRKGLKGTLQAGTGAIAAGALPLPAAVPSSSSSSLAATPTIGTVPRIATQFLPPLALESRTPRPRKWTRGVRELRTLGGGCVRVIGWAGAPTSAYADSRLPPAPPPAAGLALSASQPRPEPSQSRSAFNLPPNAASSTASVSPAPAPAASQGHGAPYTPFTLPSTSSGGSSFIAPPLASSGSAPTPVPSAFTLPGSHIPVPASVATSPSSAGAGSGSAQLAGSSSVTNVPVHLPPAPVETVGERDVQMGFSGAGGANVLS